MQSEEESASFLKKRSKKLLLVGCRAVQRQGLKSKSFFASFFSKKEVLFALFVGFDSALCCHFLGRGNLFGPGAPTKKILAFAGMTVGGVLANAVGLTFVGGLG